MINFLKHEDQYTRLNDETLRKHASITNGTYSIGSGLNYDDITDFESAIGAQMDGNLTGEHANEETVISSIITFDTDTNSYLLKLTAESGAEHDGSAYGNGARINYSTSSRIQFVETNDGDLDDIEISKLALDVSGNGNEGVYFRDGGNSGNTLVNRLLIKCDGGCYRGISIYYAWKNAIIQNCIVYGLTRVSTTYGGIVTETRAACSHLLYNNTSVKNYQNYVQSRATDEGTKIWKNNLAQGNTGGSDYAGLYFGTTAKNISEDATSPDAAYRSKDLHTNSVFVDYANDNYKIDKDGDSTNLAIVDDGEDLSGTFTDDINHDSGRRP